MFMVSNRMFECDRYKKLYEEEKKKNEELLKEIEKLNKIITDSIKTLNLKN